MLLFTALTSAGCEEASQKTEGVNVGTSIPGTPPSDAEARFQELLELRTANDWSVLYETTTLLGAAPLSDGREQALWSHTSGLDRFDVAYEEEQGLRGFSVVHDTADSDHTCHWELAVPVRASVGCFRNVDSFIITDALRYDGSTVFQPDVLFAGYSHSLGRTIECFNIMGVNLGFVPGPIGGNVEALLCFDEHGLLIRSEVDLQGRTYHVSSSAVEVRQPLLPAEHQLPLSVVGQASGSEYRVEDVPVSDVTLPDIPLIQEFLAE